MIIVILFLTHLIGHCSPSVVNDIINGLAAKYTCSNVFIGGRTVEQQRTVDIGSASYLNNVTIIVNRTDSSVIAYTKGSTIRKAIYRPGLGATLISDYTERQIRSQRFNLPAPPNSNQDYIPWPMGDKIVDHSYPLNINRTALENAIDSLFIETNPKLPIRTHAVVVVYDGKIIGEKYASGFSRKSKLLGMSMTKSITGTLMGILVQEKGLNIDEPAPVPEWNNINDSRHCITIRNLLQQTSGLNWNEPYSEHSDVLRMLFMTGDMGHYTASLPLKDKPGSQFVYSSGNTNILSRIIRHQLGDKKYYSFPYEKLFYKIGMNSFIMEVDATGTFIGSSYSWGTARDWARYGLLYYNRGVFNNKRILSEDWIKQSIASSDGYGGGRYGFQFYLNKPANKNTTKRRFPNVPTDTYYAAGVQGQDVFIIPSEKLVVVRLGATTATDYEWGADEFLQVVINSIE
ncbi:unnamed protein product [Adineta steineri]|uniref:Beta-lactamase-related domain-containing protein n=1 Tax=Adineta steineri TaxID=433720 RepID=A0A814DAN4_9BILA|nr:unnamed protein product [Adineta steineri]CAF4156918.1 unnamed protein product [Adineta steineri]